MNTAHLSDSLFYHATGTLPELSQKVDRLYTPEHRMEITDWLDKINRGGLILVSHNIYRFFYYVEMELRKHFNHQNTTCMTEGFRSKVLDLVSNDVDVLHAWRVCQRDMEDEERTELLKIISKTIQKSKALRKNIGST